MTDNSFINCLMVVVGGFVAVLAILFVTRVAGDAVGFILLFALIGGVIWYFFYYGRDTSKTGDQFTYRKPGMMGASYPSNWEDIKNRILIRDNNQCGNCGSNYNLHVHHIVPLSKGGTNKESNLRTLCENCHKKLHPHMK